MTVLQRARSHISHRMPFQHLWGSGNHRFLAPINATFLCRSVSLYGNMLRLALVRTAGTRKYLSSTCGQGLVHEVLRDFMINIQ
jgi:hypothetical protein